MATRRAADVRRSVAMDRDIVLLGAACRNPREPCRGLTPVLRFSVLDLEKSRRRKRGRNMPFRRRAVIVFTVGVLAVVAFLPASGQIVQDYHGSRGSSWTPPPRMFENRLPAPAPAVPPPLAGVSPGGISQLQAIDLLAAEGFTQILAPVPTAYGGWMTSASWQGRKVKVKVDAQGRISRR